MFVKKSFGVIGKRTVNADVSKNIKKLVVECTSKDLLLRSGGSPGWETEFFDMYPALSRNLYLPNPGYSPCSLKKHHFSSEQPSKEAFSKASSYYDSWSKLDKATRRIFARYLQVALGINLDNPVSFIITHIDPDAIALRVNKMVSILIKEYPDIPVWNVTNATSVNEVVKKIQNHEMRFKK